MGRTAGDLHYINWLDDAVQGLDHARQPSSDLQPIEKKNPRRSEYEKISRKHVQTARVTCLKIDCTRDGDADILVGERSRRRRHNLPLNRLLRTPPENRRYKVWQEFSQSKPRHSLKTVPPLARRTDGR